MGRDRGGPGHDSGSACVCTQTHNPLGLEGRLSRGSGKVQCLPARSLPLSPAMRSFRKPSGHAGGQRGHVVCQPPGPGMPPPRPPAEDRAPCLAVLWGPLTPGLSFIHPCVLSRCHPRPAYPPWTVPGPHTVPAPGNTSHLRPRATTLSAPGLWRVMSYAALYTGAPIAHTCSQVQTGGHTSVSSPHCRASPCRITRATVR